MSAQNLVANPSFEGFTKGRPTASTILVGSPEFCIPSEYSFKYNEAIQVELSEELRAGEEYRISLWVKMAPLKKSIPIPFFTALPREKEDWPAIKRGRTACDYLELWPVDTAANGCDSAWREVSAIYLAKGGESYLALGCLGDANQEIIKKKPYRITYRGIYRETYYHIDDVSVEVMSD